MNIEQLDPHKAIQIVKILKAIGEENRFQIIRLLLKSDLCVGALARILNISKPAVSQHLKVLREAGLVRGEKIGYWTHYRVEKELIRESSYNLRALIESPPDLTDDTDFICLRKEENKTGQERRTLQMCKNCCEQPDKLKTKPGECTPEQIKECHGETKEHSCENKKEK
jgi:ArsR family transcriptional regulator, arsenate/arsenite/antimonite-responsive transcriptional repressor